MEKQKGTHRCSGNCSCLFWGTCSYYEIGDVFICEKTGQVHGHCFDRFLSPSEMEPGTEARAHSPCSLPRNTRASDQPWLSEELDSGTNTAYASGSIRIDLTEFCSRKGRK
ncbi:uncharacterized protein [Arachis hypogaea]|uniref:uncharacterized protein isoform X2 n=1 Tax=Arachis hypogaea TaxID=3818 RepID=UPI003B21370A|nr:uncharacterized protein DS421_18g625920 [Arachis hypogaea]